MTKHTNYKVFPAIGIARVGNSTSAFYLGPETYCGLPLCADGSDRPITERDLRDADGRVARQAARFRVFRSVGGGPYEELTLDHPEVASIRWDVHVANKKASWYQFMTTKGEAGYAPDHPLRNPTVVDPKARTKLTIDPGPRHVEGRSRTGVSFDRGSVPPGYEGNFPPPALKPFPVDSLGELRTDPAGRLLFLGGYGHSGSSVAPAISDYANNDDWWDDTSDGPVRATIVLKSGETIEAVPAWVLVAPPKYAPQLGNLVTLYDAMFDAAVRTLGARPDIFHDGLWQRGPHGHEPNFTRDIRPIFERAAAYPWVAAIPSKPHTFDFARLGDPDPTGNGLRQYYLSYLRKASYPNTLVSPRTGGTLMPYLAGDACFSNETMDEAATSGSSFFSTLTATQYYFLQQWADGHFDGGPAPAEDVATALTRAVLDNCVGGPFSPGIEMTWICRNAGIYSEPVRIKAKARVPVPLSLGLDLNAGLEPGDASRYMALPWQADFNECAAQGIGDRTLWWWPAQRPEFVYLRSEEGNRQARQVPWIGTQLNQSADDFIMFADDLEMVHEWSRLGFVFKVGSERSPRFVEVSRTLPRPETEDVARGPDAPR